MRNTFKFTAAALAVILATGAFTASTGQAQAAKLTPGVAIGVGVGLVAGAILGNRQRTEERVYYNDRQSGHKRWNAVSRDRVIYADDDDDDDDYRPRHRHGRKFDRHYD